MRIAEKEHITKLQAYKPGKPIEELKRELGLEKVVKLASNESPIGPSPHALKAIGKFARALNRYPEGSCPLLKQALAKKLGVGVESLILGNGSNEILVLLAQVFLGKGDEAVMATPTFPIYRIATEMVGATAVQVPLLSGVHDLIAMAAAANRRTRLAYICNPNNPTGTAVNAAQLDRFLVATRQRKLLPVVDEAYYEYAVSKGYPRTLELLKRGREIVITRSFSKAYALAGLRVGYAIAPAWAVAAMERVRQPFNVNSLAQAAALAALTDKAHFKRSLAVTREGLAYLGRELNALGYRPLPSKANFLYFKRPGAEAYCAALMHLGVIVRAVGDDGVRVTVGLPRENRRLIRAMRSLPPVQGKDGQK